jgi:NADH:ubiquinone oxidoreductase subunit E
VDGILEDHDYDPKELLQILEETQKAYGFLPVAALKRISEKTGTWYAMIYGTASYYSHLRFEPPGAEAQAAVLATRRPAEAAYVAGLGASLQGRTGGDA